MKEYLGENQMPHSEKYEYLTRISTHAGSCYGHIDTAGEIGRSLYHNRKCLGPICR